MLQTQRNGQELVCALKLCSFSFSNFTLQIKNKNNNFFLQVSLYSPPFYTSRHGYKACARIYPNGDGSGKNHYLSLFLLSWLVTMTICSSGHSNSASLSLSWTSHRINAICRKRSYPTHVAHRSRSQKMEWMLRRVSAAILKMLL